MACRAAPRWRGESVDSIVRLADGIEMATEGNRASQHRRVAPIGAIEKVGR
jgi:hypothetical protein